MEKTEILEKYTNYTGKIHFNSLFDDNIKSLNEILSIAELSSAPIKHLDDLLNSLKLKYKIKC
jgi:hypothetical protein